MELSKNGTEIETEREREELKPKDKSAKNDCERKGGRLMNMANKKTFIFVLFQDRTTNSEINRILWDKLT